MSNTIRWGLLSTARINDSIIEPIRQSARSELIAVASRDTEKAQLYAKTKGIPKAHGSYEALLADPDVDVVYNSLPNSLHCEWTVKAAEAGKHVLCEKPIVISLAELEAVETATKLHSVTIFEGFKHLHHPAMLMVIDMINSGHLGALQLINICHGFHLPLEDKNNFRLNYGLGGGSLWDTGVYANSLAIVFAQAGPPVEVWAIQVNGETGVDVSIMGQMRFANGVMAQISCGFLFPLRHKDATLVGSQGLIQFSDPWTPDAKGENSKLIFATQHGIQEIVIPPCNAFLCEVEAMEACVLDGAEPVIPLALSRTFLQSVLALHESADSGRVVRI